MGESRLEGIPIDSIARRLLLTREQAILWIVSLGIGCLDDGTYSVGAYDRIMSHKHATSPFKQPVIRGRDRDRDRDRDLDLCDDSLVTIWQIIRMLKCEDLKLESVRKRIQRSIRPVISYPRSLYKAVDAIRWAKEENKRYETNLAKDL